MRVTKIIKEYVEKTVSALPKFKDKTPEELAYKEMCAKIDSFKTGVADEVEHFVNEAIARFKAENNIPEDIKIEFHTSYYPVSSSMWCSEIKAASDKSEKARTSAKVKAIEEMLKALAEGGDA